MMLTLRNCILNDTLQSLNVFLVLRPEEPVCPVGKQRECYVVFSLIIDLRNNVHLV